MASEKWREAAKKRKRDSSGHFLPGVVTERKPRKKLTKVETVELSDTATKRIQERDTIPEKKTLDKNDRTYVNLMMQINRLKSVEQQAKDAIEETRGGVWYSWKDNVIARLQETMAMAKVQRLELEISKTPYYRINFEGK
jgi:hypothetical protein